jgi:hypothetical protein
VNLKKGLPESARTKKGGIEVTEPTDRQRAISARNAKEMAAEVLKCQREKSTQIYFQRCSTQAYRQMDNCC